MNRHEIANTVMGQESCALEEVLQKNPPQSMPTSVPESVSLPQPDPSEEVSYVVTENAKGGEGAWSVETKQAKPPISIDTTTSLSHDLSNSISQLSNVGSPLSQTTPNLDVPTPTQSTVLQGFHGNPSWRTIPLPLKANDLGLPNIPLGKELPSSIDAAKPSTNLLDDSSDTDPNKTVATAAYRDLHTGAVVETDQDGHQAAPTVHPDLSTLAAQKATAPGGLPVLSILPMKMPGLEAAADLLNADVGIDGDAAKGDAAKANNTGNDSDTASTWNGIGYSVTGFAVASSKRNADFHALFPSVPEDDFLIENYTCALSRDLLIQGRLYLSESHLCFHSSIFGWVTSIVIPFSEVISIEKRNTAYLIPNAISVRTLESRYLFSSLVSRDMVYSMLVNIWRMTAPSAAAQQMAESATDDDVATEEDHGTLQAVPEVKEEERKLENTDVLTSQGEEFATAANKREKLRKRLTKARKNAKKGKDGKKVSANSDEHDADDETGSSSDEDEKEHEPTKCNCDKTNSHLPVLVIDEKFDATPHQLFDLMFKGDFMSDFLSNNQKLIDVEIGEWNDKEKTLPEATATRKVTYIKPLNGSVGPKQTKCQITDEQLHIDFHEFCTTMTTTKTPDVPSGNNFSVHTRTCFTWAENNRARLYITCEVAWKGRSMLKSIIDKASVEGQKDYYKELSKALRAHIKSHPDIYGTKKSSSSKDKEHGEKEPVEELIEEETKPASTSPLSMLMDTLDSLNISLSVLILSLLIVILLISNIWVYTRGSNASMRDPRNPHVLLQRDHVKGYSQPLQMRHVKVLVDEEVQDVLDALAYSRRMTEALEEDIRELQDIIKKRTKPDVENETAKAHFLPS